MDHNERYIDLIILDDDDWKKINPLNDCTMKIDDLIVIDDDDECSIIKSTSINLKDESINLKDESINLKDSSTDLKNKSINLRDSSTDLKDTSTNLKDSSTDLKDTPTNLKDKSINLIETINIQEKRLINDTNNLSNSNNFNNENSSNNKLNDQIYKLENKMDKIDSKLDKIENKIDKMDSELDKIDKMDSKSDKINKSNNDSLILNNNNLINSLIINCDQENSFNLKNDTNLIGSSNLKIDDNKTSNNELNLKLIELDSNKEDNKLNGQLFLEDVIGLKRDLNKNLNENQISTNLNKLKDNDNLIDNETNVNLNSVQLNNSENNLDIEVYFSTDESEINDKNGDKNNSESTTNKLSIDKEQSTTLNIPNQTKRPRKSKLIEMEANYEFFSYKKFKKLPITSNSNDNLSTDKPSTSSGLTKRNSTKNKTSSKRHQKCLVDKDRFCYMCGRLMDSKLALNISENKKHEFKDYFKIDLILNKWCSSFICSNCKNQLNKHKNGKLKRKTFMKPVIWLPPKNHPYDCYFCNVKIDNLSADSKTTKFIECSKSSVIAPVKNIDSDQRNKFELSYEEYIERLKLL